MGYTVTELIGIMNKRPYVGLRKSSAHLVSSDVTECKSRILCPGGLVLTNTL